MFDLTGRTALVTGASRGLGRSIALRLAAAGADIVVNYAGAEEKARSAAKEIEDLGRKATVIRCDVGSETDVDAMFATIDGICGGLDILVNNAGINSDFDIETMRLEEWDRILRCNLTGNFLCARRAVAMMKKVNRGRIIQISSVVGEQGALYGQIHYASTKAGQIGFTKTLARSVAKYGITVNAIAPGIHMTEQVEDILGSGASPRLEAAMRNIALGRLGSSDDIGNAAVYLASDEAAYITGAVLDVNGGIFMR